MRAPKPSTIAIFPEEGIGPCALCGEPGADAEMYDPEAHELLGVIVHVDCGCSAGMEVA